MRESHSVSIDRRSFLASGAALAASIVAPQAAFAARQEKGKPPIFKISLAEWSFHRALYEKRMDHLDFAMTAKKEFGIDAIEYVNSFFKDKAKDADYLKEMIKRCDDNGVKSKLIMCDGEGNLGDADDTKRTQAV